VIKTDISTPIYGNTINLVDISSVDSYAEKCVKIKEVKIKGINQYNQLKNPDSVVAFDAVDQNVSLLNLFAVSYQGLRTGDINRFIQCFWERTGFNGGWEPFQTTIKDKDSGFSGLTGMIFWQDGQGELHKYASATRERLHDMHESGNRAWGRSGIAVEQMGALCATFYLGNKFDNSLAVIYPIADKGLMPAIASFLMSDEYMNLVRQIDQSIKVTNATLIKVPFDSVHWQFVAAEAYPQGLPKPFSNDVTQWIFHGHPQPSTEPLQVAVARLLGYTWPAETDDKMELSDEAREWVARSQAVADHADEDGIVCIPAVGQESSASDRLLNLLAAAYGDAWSNDTLAQLLTEADHAGKSLETWLREKFFTQHCKRFGNRPFIWHVWDGLRDGFAALVNYHKLDYKTLESLIYTYLGDWISRQKRDVVNAVDGAQEKLAAAEVLKKRLELILEGETPYDIFVRWKPIEKQPIGWNPDLNNGVRMNIRPFLSVPDVGKRGAGVLRDKPNIKWEKDRGADVASAPWYDLGPEYGGNKGDRINDHHLTLAEKRAARGSQ
jgi:hypothetical protein